MKINVVGAGLAGLAVATWAKEKGHEVSVFEADHRPAGRAFTITRDSADDRVDVGTQYFHSNYRRALSLIKKMGLEKDLQKIKGRTRFFDDQVKGGSFTTGHRIPTIASGSLWQNLQMMLVGVLRMARHPIDPYAVLEGSSIDEVTAGEAIQNPFEWEYNVRTLVSAGALVEPGPNDVSYLHVIRLMRIIVMTDYLTLKGGIASLHEALAAHLSVRYGAEVSSLLWSNEKVRGVMLKNGESIESDVTILATPPHATGLLLPEAFENERAFLASIDHPPAVIVTLFLDRKLEAGVWSYVFRPNDNRWVSFCVDTSQKNPKGTASEKTALQAWVCHPASKRTMEMSDDALAEVVLDELSTDFPALKGQVEEVHVHRVSHAVPQTAPGHNAKARDFLNRMDQRQGLECCGDYLSGGYMECALWSAERAVSRLER